MPPAGPIGDLACPFLPKPIDAIERMFYHLKNLRHVATRCDRDTAKLLCRCLRRRDRQL